MPRTTDTVALLVAHQISKDARVSRGDAEDMAQRAGVTPLFHVVTTRARLYWALSDVYGSIHHLRTLREGYKRGHEVVRYAVMRKTDSEYMHDTRLCTYTLSDRGGVRASSNVDVRDLEEVRRIFNSPGDLRAASLQRGLVRMLRINTLCVPVTPRGGFYFCPPSSEKYVRRLRSMARALQRVAHAGHIVLHVCPLYGDDARSWVRDSVRTRLLSDGQLLVSHARVALSKKRTDRVRVCERLRRELQRASLAARAFRDHDTSRALLEMREAVHTFAFKEGP